MIQFFFCHQPRQLASLMVLMALGTSHGMREIYWFMETLPKYGSVGAHQRSVRSSSNTGQSGVSAMGRTRAKKLALNWRRGKGSQEFWVILQFYYKNSTSWFLKSQLHHGTRIVVITQGTYYAYGILQCVSLDVPIVILLSGYIKSKEVRLF